MPPKVKITKEDIINAAIEIVKANGEEAINARNIAATLGCSTQPVFSNFASMEELRLAVVERVDMLCNQYMEREVATGKYPAYKASGMAYIRFAKEEKQLFRLLYMRDRSKEIVSEDTEAMQRMEDMIYENTGLAGDDAKLFHLEMWAYVHGIATMLATGFQDLEWEFISKLITDAYQGLKKQHEKDR